MTYISLINNFWQQHAIEEFSLTEIALYLYLLNACNGKRWPASFTLSNKKLVIALNLTEATILRARKKLVLRGLISYKKGKFDARIPEYTITGVDETSSDFTLENSSNLADFPQTSRRNIVGKSQHIIDNKNIDNNTEEGCNSRAGKTARDANEETPSFEEVCEYFDRKGTSAGLRDARASARRFYDTFAAVGWRDRYNRRISAWQNRANQWITDDINKHGSGSGRNPSIGIPIRGKYVPSCGLERPDFGEDGAPF